MYRRFGELAGVWAHRLGFNVVPSGCLGACDRPCVGKLEAGGKMTNLIGGLHEEQTTSDLVPCVALYRQSRHGVAAFTMSPARLKAQFLAKWVP